MPLPNYFNLIDEEEYLRGYVEYNADFSDTQEFHFELSYAKTTNPNIDAGNSLPNGGKRATATNTFPAFPNGAFTVPYTQNLYNAAGVAMVGTTAVNPYAAEFFNRLNANRAAAGLAPVAAANLLTHNQWRPLMFGPNGLFEGGHRVRSARSASASAARSRLSGEFTRGRPVQLGFRKARPTSTRRTYSEYTNTVAAPGLDDLAPAGRAERLWRRVLRRDRPRRDELCQRPRRYDASVGIQSDTAPGTNGCEYFNPFASSFANSFVNGAANPSYGGASFENSAALLRLDDARPPLRDAPTAR